MFLFEKISIGAYCNRLHILKKGETSAKFSPRQQQVQNFPQLVIKFILKNIRTDTMVAGSNLSWQGIKRKAVYTEGAGLVCKCTGQCTLEGNVQGGASA